MPVVVEDNDVAAGFGCEVVVVFSGPLELSSVIVNTNVWVTVVVITRTGLAGDVVGDAVVVGCGRWREGVFVGVCTLDVVVLLTTPPSPPPPPPPVLTASEMGGPGNILL